MEALKYHSTLHPFLDLLELGTIGLSWSRHAQARAREKRFELLSEITVGEGQIFELAVRDTGKHKYGVRIPYTDRDDLILVIIHTGEADVYRVITAWLNSVDDAHATLDQTYYWPAWYERSV